ncbi:MAG: SDR family oxidoreductase [Armatimonadetes bacterium]|nr:SDR family oxidoreductase [Armatimonadota bacterium]
MEQRFAGQSVIVSGGSAGFGLGAAQRFAAEGATVWITGRDEARLAAAAAGTALRPVAADACDPVAWERLVAEVVTTTGRLDVLLNNAGAGVMIAPVDEQTPAAIQESITVNLLSAIFGCRAVVPTMKAQRRGTIVNVLSICAREAWPGWSIYSAAKAGLRQFTECLQVELRAHGVRAGSLIPSWGATSFSAASDLPSLSPEVLAQAIQPEEFGALVADICATPPHLTILDATLLPLVQRIEPL